MSKRLFQIEIAIVATVYLRAETAEAAKAEAAALAGSVLEVPEDEHGEIPISGRPYSDPDLPELSLSPAMTVQGLADATAEAVPAEEDEAEPTGAVGPDLITPGGQLIDLKTAPAPDPGREIHYRAKRPTFETPYTIGPENCRDIRSRIGQPFEIVGVDVSDELMEEGGGGPKFDIRFPDGLTIVAHEEEVFADA